MTPQTFAPCATFAREALATPLIPYACERRPPTKAAQKATTTKWGAAHGWSRSHGVWLGHLRAHVQMQRVAATVADGIETRPTFWVGLAKLATSHDLGLPMVEVEASPVDTLPARIHAAACALLATYATRLDAQAAALTEEAAAVRALIPTPETTP